MVDLRVPKNPSDRNREAVKSNLQRARYWDLSMKHHHDPKPKISRKNPFNNHKIPRELTKLFICDEGRLEACRLEKPICCNDRNDILGKHSIRARISSMWAQRPIHQQAWFRICRNGSRQQPTAHSQHLTSSQIHPMSATSRCSSIPPFVIS